MISGCLICQSVRNNPPAAPLHPWPWAALIWQRVYIEFAEKGEHNYLIVVDSHNKWLEVCVNIPLLRKQIDVLRKLFSSHGLCEEIVPDNGPQFMSHVFKSFCEANSIKHNRVVPYHPHSNSAAERCVRIRMILFHKYRYKWCNKIYLKYIMWK